MQHAHLVLTNFRSAPLTTIQPRMSLASWRVMDCLGKRFLVGFLENGITCRVTTEIASLDLVAREARTQSGRQYDLFGPPATDPTSLTVIALHAALRPPDLNLDVTQGVWASMQRVTA